MELSTLPRIATVSGQTLNVEEISGLESAMVERKLEEKLTGEILTDLFRMTCAP